MTQRVAIIGAGPAGLLAARSLQRAGIPYDQFERHTDVGGIWDIRSEGTPMYATAHFISSKHVSYLPGYPMPDDYPDYPDHRRVLAYLRAFARDHGLYDAIRFGTAVQRVERLPDGGWELQLADGSRQAYRALYLCSGNTWDPWLPDIPGDFDGEVLHSIAYDQPARFEGKRVLVVGGGNSGCDIACDAASRADAAFLSLRRGYHFIPKHVLGMPADVFAGGLDLPRAIEVRVMEGLLRLVVGDLTRFGLPAPDHRILESHPIVNTQVLHHLAHGDLAYRPDVERLDGDSVVFVDGRREAIDVVVYATGYKVSYPFMARDHFTWHRKYPDLFLTALHRQYDDLCCLGLHQTDGGAFDLFALQADMMTNFLLDQQRDPARAERFRQLKATARPDLSGGRRYVDSARHETYAKKATFLRYSESLFDEFGWTRFGSGTAEARRPSLRTRARRRGARWLGRAPGAGAQGV